MTGLSMGWGGSGAKATSAGAVTADGGGPPGGGGGRIGAATINCRAGASTGTGSIGSGGALSGVGGVKAGVLAVTVAEALSAAAIAAAFFVLSLI